METSTANKKMALSHLTEKAAPRKDISSYREESFDAIREDIEKDISFVTSLMVASMKHVDPTKEDQDFGEQVTKATQQIGELRSMINTLKMNEKMAEDMKNPGFSPTILQGSMISYDDSIRKFDGKEPVTFNYTLSFPAQFKNGTANTELLIKNADGKVVFKTKGASDEGDQTFSWGGIDKKGNKLEPGEYTLLVKSEGSITVDGKHKTFAVDSNMVKNAKVEEVKVKGGKADKIVLEGGKIIDKEALRIFKGKPKKLDESQKVDVGMIAKKASVDMSKIQIKDSKTTIRYFTEDDITGGVKLEIYDDKGKLVKEIDHKKKLEAGYGSIPLKDGLAGLENGNYTVKIGYKDPANEDKTLYLDLEDEVLVAGINRKTNSFTNPDGVEFSAHSITKVASPHAMSTEQALRTKYLGKEIEYKDDEYTWKTGKELEYSRFVKRPAEGSGKMLAESRLRIYDGDKLVKIVSVPFEPVNMLVQDDKDQVEVDSNNNLGIVYDENISKENLVKVNRMILKGIADEDYELLPKFKDSFVDNGMFEFHYKWDGSFDEHLAGTPGIKAVDGTNYRVELETVYVDGEGKPVVSEEDETITKTSMVKEFRELGFHKFEIEMENGDVITDDRMIRVIQPKQDTAATAGDDTL